MKKIRMTHHRLQAAHDRQKEYANKDRDGLSYEVDDLFHLKVYPLKGPIGERVSTVRIRYSTCFKVKIE
ncbi:hypothetical protein Syun_022676 [Stephania yunnanensis]|uniref:Uncharacterized protein n=1 Tax=Stephania yunnanensis TaxID=152371 RepID=A0AAP0I301_9MAGN